MMHNTISFNQNSIDINLVRMIKPYWLTNISFFPFVLNEIKKKLNDRVVNLWALRNTPISPNPYRAVINLIVDQLAMPADRILIHTRDPDFFHAGVTKVPYNVWDEHWRQNDLNPFLKSFDLLQSGPEAKRFGALFGRMQLGRILLAYHLENFHKDLSHVSFLCEQNFLQHEVYAFEEFFEDISEWWNRRSRSVDPSVNLHHSFGQFDWPQNIVTYPSVAQLFQIEIVSETDYCRLGDYTEKTWRALAIGKPFILLCGPGSLKLLRDLGFETFSPWINESYDSCADDIVRIQHIQQEIDRLAKLDAAQWQQTMLALADIAQRNYKFYHQWQPKVTLP